MSIVYDDAYLVPFCTSVREERASEYVDLLSSDFSAEWHDELTKIRCYIIACIEQQGSPEDLFAEKLKVYNKEFDNQLVYARIDVADTAGDPSPAIFSVPLERA